MQDQNSKKHLYTTILITLVAFLLSGAISYGASSYILKSPEKPISPTVTYDSQDNVKIDPSEPKTEECPLNGALYTKTEQNIWKNRRPLFVMIENHTEARPQSGLSSADIIYEAVVEGGITRFGAVYLCDIAARDTILGPVRSARTHFINWASEYNYPLYAHVGGANCSPTDPNNPSRTCQTDKRVQALEQLDKYGWVGSKGNDLNQFSIGHPTFWRDYDRMGRTVATEHTMYTSTEKLYEYAKNRRGWTNMSPNGNDWKGDFKQWSFKDQATEQERGDATTIKFDFWDNYADFTVVWTYDKASNTYSRQQGGKPHTDLNTKQPIKVKNVVVQFIKEEGPVDPLHHMFYYNIGKGKAIVFRDGKAIPATWVKKDRESRTVFKDKSGNEIEFNRGKIFIEGVPAGNKIEY